MKISKKYPESLFVHWIVMLSTMNANFTKKGFKKHIEDYLNFEGEDEFKALQDEVNTIIENGDLLEFEEVGKYFKIKEVDKDSLELMADVIRNWNPPS